jgi:transcriptional regulator of acetoin/glycerol metabolism
MKAARGQRATGEAQAIASTPKPVALTATPQLDTLVQSEPDLVDRIFDYALKLRPDIAAKADELEAAKDAVRHEFAGERAYIRRRPRNLADRVLAIFNGRNATETARELGIGRATVYRKLKQPGESS